MTDIEIIHQIHDEVKRVDHPPFDPVVINFYGRLIERVPEDGFVQYLPDKWITEKEEQALLELTRYGFLDSGSNHSASDGFTWYVNLRGKRFLEIANRQKKSVVVGMLDSGKRDTFETGAVRDSGEGKPRPDLFSAFAMDRIGRWMEMGARKYEPHNWAKGMNYSRVAASLHRHLMMYMQGDRLSEDHLAAIAVNASFLMHYDAMIKRGVLPQSLDDLPKYQAASNNGDHSP
ncbi:MAG: DUF5664 domain-containing protein [Planctomycetaceae bacterium]|nr:DUF5664 domain-containing protein [Planctomycetaceae bacterium]